MDREWQAVLNRYGQKVEIVQRENGPRKLVRAFVQNVLDKDAQLAPSPPGLRREERVLYLGPARLELLPRESTVFWAGQVYDVTSARRVGDGHHMWAILQRREASA